MGSERFEFRAPAKLAVHLRREIQRFPGHKSEAIRSIVRKGLGL